MEKTHHSLIINGVHESEQTLAINKPFWVFLGGNTGIATWLIGVLVAGMGLDMAHAVFVIVLGSLVGSALPALTSVIGPKTGLSQIEASRFALGASGKKLPALLNWINAIGWDVINNVISATAFIMLLADYNIKIPMWGALFGYVTASAVTKQSPEGVMMALQILSGHFAPYGFIISLVHRDSSKCFER